jgi:thiol-disulfide isomerase/thioredoxin
LFSTFNSFLELASNNHFNTNDVDSVLTDVLGFNQNMIVDTNLDSKEFLRFVRSYYLQHCVKMDIQTKGDSLLDKYHTQGVILQRYSGAVRDYVLHDYLVKSIENSVSHDDLDTFTEIFNKAKNSIHSNQYIGNIYSSIDKIKKELTGSSTGAPAPRFSGIDENGRPFSIEQFKGKVLYIDLWASWCLPCRKETPYLDDIHKHFRKDTNVVIIGISVFDRKKSWLEAIQVDKPRWLQLYDAENKVASFFTGIVAIPKFVVVDKNGNVVSFNAPLPHDTLAVIELLSRESQKN